MNKNPQLSTWLTVVPSVILAVALVLSNNGIDLASFGWGIEGILALCGALVAGGIVTAPDPTVPTNETKEDIGDPIYEFEDK